MIFHFHFCLKKRQFEVSSLNMRGIVTIYLNFFGHSDNCSVLQFSIQFAYGVPCLIKVYSRLKATVTSMYECVRNTNNVSYQVGSMVRLMAISFTSIGNHEQKEARKDINEVHEPDNFGQEEFGCALATFESIWETTEGIWTAFMFPA